MKKSKSPSPLSEPRTGAGAARERTLAHMDRLLRKATTTVGTGLLLACAAQAQKARPPQVCDPLPVPPQGCCENPDEALVRKCILPQAVWLKSDGRLSLAMSVYTPRRGPIGFEGLSREDTKTSGASLKELRVQPKQADFVFLPAPDAKQAILEFPVTCNGKKATLKLSVDVSAPPAENAFVPVKQVK